MAERSKPSIGLCLDVESGTAALLRRALVGQDVEEVAPRRMRDWSEPMVIVTRGGGEADPTTVARGDAPARYVVNVASAGAPELEPVLVELVRARLDCLRQGAALRRLQSTLTQHEELLRRSMVDKGRVVLSQLEAARARQVDDADARLRDPATHLLRHGSFRQRLIFEVDRSRQTGEPLALLLLDLDRFGRFNEEHGYEAGDRVLHMVAGSLQSLWLDEGSSRPPVLGRDSGDRFAFILPNCEHPEAERRAEQIRHLVENLPGVPGAARARLTGCVGGVTCDGELDDAELWRACIASLEQARARGPNQVLVSDRRSAPPEEQPS